MTDVLNKLSAIEGYAREAHQMLDIASYRCLPGDERWKAASTVSHIIAAAQMVLEEITEGKGEVSE